MELKIEYGVLHAEQRWPDEFTERVAAMTKDHQAALEQAARDVVDRFIMGTKGSGYTVIEGDDADTLTNMIAQALAAQRAKVLEEALKEGEVWSFMRRVLSQGGDIQLDYQTGKYKGYEEYSARLDAAARERADQFIKEAQEQRP